ncbi:MAG TPA: hypothetical protein VLT82_01530 [Myxococcaceae bacterium]|nr:hypothetical protein [Myxococcaceae bacterium]
MVSENDSPVEEEAATGPSGQTPAPVATPSSTPAPTSASGTPAEAPRRASPEPPANDVTALWYALVGRQWTSLAILAPDDSPRAWRLVQKLEEVARANQYRALKAVKILDLTMDRAEAIAHAVGKVSSLGERKRYLIAIDSPLENPVAIRVLSACDAALLVLEKDRSRIPDAQRTVEMVGRGRLIGAVLGSP